MTWNLTLGTYKKCLEGYKKLALLSRGSKCAFGKTTVTYLGFQYSSSGATPSAKRIQAVTN